jgi:hypothetical protein
VIDPTTGLAVPHLVLVEVKNRRLTLYPRHAEVHQLLHKAALAAQAFPGQPIVPALICRRGHSWLFWMAKDLGFRVLQTRRQFFTLPDKTDPRYLTEVQEELGFDLHAINGAMPNIIDFFRSTLPKESAVAAQRWKLMAPVVLRFSAELRKDTLTEHERTVLLNELYLNAELVLKQNGLDEPLTWTLPPEDAYENPTDL